MDNSTMTKIDLFFEDPAILRRPPGRYSVLYLLRRDINTCMGIDPDRPNCQALWPGAMAIFAGIDLLGKFLAGDDSFRSGKSSTRFKNFVRTYFQAVSQENAAIIYQLRNSLLHSFGLYSMDSQGNEYIFTLIDSQTQGPLVRDLGSGHYLVDIRTLHNLFETAITNYEADLKKDSSLQDNFAAMFPKYGVVDIGRHVVRVE